MSLPVGSLHRAAALAAAAAALAPACAREVKPPPPHRPTVHVRSFSDVTPVRALAVSGNYVFAATSRGLDRWEPATGQRLSLTAEHGLPGDRVTALAPAPDGSALWIATDGGLTRHDLGSGNFDPVPPPPDELAAIAADVRALVVDGDGVWAGGPAGLARATVDGWSPAPATGAVTALLRDDAGRLWIGTGGGVLVRAPDGAIRRLDGGGCGLRGIRAIVRAPDGAVLVIGDEPKGEQRVARIPPRSDVCSLFRVSPDQRWLAAARRGDEVVVLTQRRVHVLSVPTRGARGLRREGVRLVPIPGADGKHPRHPYVIRTSRLRTPTGATALAAAGDALAIGTVDLGSLYLARGSQTWLRRTELATDAHRVTVACRAADDCLIATGAPHAWRFDGKRFAPVDVPLADAVFAVVRASDGAVYGVYRVGREPRVRVARVVGDEWRELEAIDVRTPGFASEVAFARMGPGGVLWIGLRYVDADGESRAHGVVEVQLSLGVVAYHRASRDETAVEQGVLPIPIDVRDIAFVGDDEVWLATTEGVTRIRGRSVEVVGEAKGLRSELLHAVAASTGGLVFIAARDGVGVFDGDTWTYPPTLRRDVRAMVIGADGKLWMATPRGLAVYDGASVRLLDSRRGLLDNELRDLALDRYGRVWVLSEAGLSIVTP